VIAAVILLGAVEFFVLLGTRRSSPEPPSAQRDSFQKGIVLGLFARDEPGYARKNLGEIRGLGANSVSIVIPWVTPDVRSEKIAPRGDMTPSDGSLRAAIREAHLAGMRVLLLPLIYVDEMAEGEWRGTISPPDWGRWFRSYERMILHYAAVARDEKVELLSIGSELCSTEGKKEEWLGIVSRVRRDYDGALTYSANWDHRESVSFAESLDFLGMNAYFELSDDPDAGVDELLRSWVGIQKEVEAWRSRVGKPLVLTEVGYPSRRGATANPWNYEAGGPPDLDAQERGYRAFVSAWTGYPALEGVYFYLWWGEGGPADVGYTPRGKPAESVIKEWYSRGLPGGAE